MNWMDVSKAMDELKKHMVTSQMIEWLQHGHDILKEAEE